MKKFFTELFFLTIISSMVHAQDVKIFHYNIKELDSVKIQKGLEDSQLKNVNEILSQFDFDILSLNEVQYDLPNVPEENYLTTGKNLHNLRQLFNLNKLNEQSFNIANTGLNAEPNADGSYHTNANDAAARAQADQVNFGTLPGQYSTGALFKYKKINEIVFNDIKWKDFNPNLDLTKYKLANGENVPDDIELFDKNFTDVVMNVNGKKLHLILLHTVPAFNFGNSKSVNYERNADQLRFLEWYLTGKTDYHVNLPQIATLNSSDYFIAVGDWNTEYNNLQNQGSTVLRRLVKKTKLWLGDPDKLTFTNESSGYKMKSYKLMLDYMICSKNIDIVEAKIIHPNFSRIDLGCNDFSEKTPSNYVLIQYRNNDELCSAYIHESYKQFKEASDHYPIWGHFKLN